MGEPSAAAATDAGVRETSDEGGVAAAAVDPLIATDDNAAVPAVQGNEVIFI